MSRRGQSSVEPLLGFSALWLAGLSVCWWRFDALLVAVHDVSVAFQQSALFDWIANRLGGA